MIEICMFLVNNYLVDRKQFHTAIMSDCTNISNPHCPEKVDSLKICSNNSESIERLCYGTSISCLEALNGPSYEQCYDA